MGILRDKLFHLRAAVTGLVRNLPITIALLAAASFLSTVFFSFQSKCDKHFHHIYSGYYSHRTGHQKLRSRHPGLSVQCFLGKLCLHLPLYGSQFYPVRIPCHLCGNGHHLLLYQQHLHHADPSKRPAEGAGAKAHGSGERGHARQSPACHLA